MRREIYRNLRTFRFRFWDFFHQRRVIGNESVVDVYGKVLPGDHVWGFDILALDEDEAVGDRLADREYRSRRLFVRSLAEICRKDAKAEK